jgi:c-di-GMP-binding flagellar brake protein YcgR
LATCTGIRLEAAMEFEERRRYRRYPLYCPIEYRCEDDSPIEASITLNMSEGGALISTEEPLTADTRMILKVCFKGEVFFIRARVVHVQNEKGGKAFSVGVEFLQNPFDFTRKFYEELEAIMLYQRQYSYEAGRFVTLSEASMKWYSSDA